MAEPQLSSPMEGRFAAHVAQTANREKNQRIARDALRDLMMFSNLLESDLQQLVSMADKGQPVDTRLVALMSSVRDKYHSAMSGLKTLNDEMESYAMTSLADAIQDLMYYLHQRKEH